MNTLEDAKMLLNSFEISLWQAQLALSGAENRSWVSINADLYHQRVQSHVGDLASLQQEVAEVKQVVSQFVTALQTTTLGGEVQW